VLAGVSAGAICWFEQGITDSYGGVDRLDGALGFLDGSFCPHWDGEPARQPVYRALVADGLHAGYAADDGAAVHFVDGALRQVVTSRPAARAFRVARGDDGAVVETPLPARYLGA